MAFVPIEKERHFIGQLSIIKKVSSNGLYITSNDILEYYHDYWYLKLREDGLEPEAFSLEDCIDAFLESEDSTIIELPIVRIKL